MPKKLVIGREDVTLAPPLDVQGHFTAGCTCGHDHADHALHAGHHSAAALPLQALQGHENAGAIAPQKLTNNAVTRSLDAAFDDLTL